MAAVEAVSFEFLKQMLVEGELSLLELLLAVFLELIVAKFFYLK